MPIYYRPKQEFGVVSSAEIYKYIKEIKDPDFQTCLAVSWLSGARINEIIKLKKENIVIDGDLVQFTIKASKGGKTGFPTFAFGDPFINEIVNYIKKRKDGESIFRWTTTRTYQLKLASLNKLIYPKRKKNWITFHYLRHSRITWLARRGATALEIKSWTGHRSAAFEEYFAASRVRRFAGKIK